MNNDSMKSPTKNSQSRHSSVGNLSDFSSSSKPRFVTTGSTRGLLPSLATEVPLSSIKLTPMEFAASVPVFRRDRFDLFGLHGI